MAQEQIIGNHSFTFNQSDSGGEHLTLNTTIYHNGDEGRYGMDGLFFNQKLTLQSYSNSASFELTSASITPEKLRKLADELEEEINTRLLMRDLQKGPSEETLDKWVKGEL